jgi:UDP-N-acetylmuramoyl-L-alanyl-D-glutamate--2,6-diaminopimelate ligase
VDTTSLAKLLGHDAEVPLQAAGLQISGLAADSRKVKPGFVFAALPGTKGDGATYVEQAFANGAVAAIGSKGLALAGKIIIGSDNPRRLLALMAARFWAAQPETIVAVTGTNGKTSVAVFVRQIWAAMGFRAASIGTIGVVGPEGTSYLQHTTPDPVELHEIAASLRHDHVKHLAIEASSHGLSQYRLDGLLLTAGGFTNITRDHLDYHGNFDDYLAAKMRLFGELLPQGAAAVINMDSPHGEAVDAVARSRGLVCVGVGTKGKDIALLSSRREGLEQHLAIRTAKADYRVTLPLVGDFQTSNALVAAGLVIAAGGDESQAFHALESLKGATGRLDLVGRSAKGASVFVDYAHTPDALENAILALRPYATARLSVVFGCGGDRDTGKRSMMGAVAAQHADRVIVTDDNPRSEDAAKIRAAILQGAVGAREIGNRALAIRSAVEELEAGDILLVAGKGHELGQIIGAQTIAFSDHEAVHAALRGEAYHG